MEDVYYLWKSAGAKSYLGLDLFFLFLKCYAFDVFMFLCDKAKQNGWTLKQRENIVWFWLFFSYK